MQNQLTSIYFCAKYNTSCVFNKQLKLVAAIMAMYYNNNQMLKLINVTSQTPSTVLDSSDYGSFLNSFITDGVLEITIEDCAVYYMRFRYNMGTEQQRILFEQIYNMGKELSNFYYKLSI